MEHSEIVNWLLEEEPARLEELFHQADAVRRAHVGDAVHLRGLIEISNFCVRKCAYCGLNAGHASLTRYRMTAEEILDCARRAHGFGYGTVVLQAGEDYGIAAGWMADVIRRIKNETGLAVTLSLGERTDADFIAWESAGADRYLLRFETSDCALYRQIHPTSSHEPAAEEHVHPRVRILRRLREIGYEIGSGVMIGIPGQSYEMLARDIEMFRTLDLDMVGVGPYLPHPETPLGADIAGVTAPHSNPEATDQAPNTEAMTYKVIALTRLACPQANIPSTTALATLNIAQGRELGLQRGANIVMPNVTPANYRELYEIYPGKACIKETDSQCHACMKGRIAAIGRPIGVGPGGRKK